MPLEHFVDNNGVRIHCIEFNPEDSRTPLVMVPGMGNAAEEIEKNIGDLLSRHAVALSLRGRGKSDSPETGWTVADQASDIAAVFKHFGFDTIFLFGHSTGSSIATRSLPMLVATVRGFIIGDFAPFYPPYSQKWREHVKRDFPFLTITDIALEGIVRDAEYTDVSEYLNAVSENLLVLTGDEDKSLLRSEEIEHLKKLFPSLVMERLAGCSHEFLSDDPKRSMQVIDRFMLEREGNT